MNIAFGKWSVSILQSDPSERRDDQPRGCVRECVCGGEPTAATRRRLLLRFVSTARSEATGEEAARKDTVSHLQTRVQAVV